MRKIRIGFIGAGKFASTILYPSLAELEDASITAACDLNAERLERVVRQYEIPRKFVNYKEMLDKMELDAVYILISKAISGWFRLGSHLGRVTPFLFSLRTFSQAPSLSGKNH